LSAERIAKEMLRLLEAMRPAPVLRVMAATGILSLVLPGELDMARFERLCELDVENRRDPDPVLRLAALVKQGDGAAIAARWKLSNADRDRLAAALAEGDRIASHLKAPDVRRLLYRLGTGTFRDRVWLAWAAAPKSQPALAWRMLLAMAESWERPRFPLSGRDVMAAGVSEGAGVGTILASLEAEWADSDFTLDEAALRTRLTALAGELH
jgi:poly(A) polymerase